MSLKNLVSVLPPLMLIVLTVKISDWFLAYDDGTDEIINTVMFSLIGLYYLIMGFQLKNIWKFVFAGCGVYLILMNFLPENPYITVIGIICMLIPMIVAKRVIKTDRHQTE